MLTSTTTINRFGIYKPTGNAGTDKILLEWQSYVIGCSTEGGGPQNCSRYTRSMVRWTDMKGTLSSFLSLCQGCEHHGPEPVNESSWSLYQLSAKRNLRLEITEMSEVFAPDHYPGSEFHSTFIHMLQEDMSADGITKTRGSNYMFVDTVQSLLCATRPLMHS